MFFTASFLWDGKGGRTGVLRLLYSLFWGVENKMQNKRTEPKQACLRGIPEGVPRQSKVHIAFVLAFAKTALVPLLFLSPKSPVDFPGVPESPRDFKGKRSNRARRAALHRQTAKSDSCDAAERRSSFRAYGQKMIEICIFCRFLHKFSLVLFYCMGVFLSVPISVLRFILQPLIRQPLYS